MSALNALTPLRQRLAAVPVSLWRRLVYLLVGLWLLWLLAKAFWRVEETLFWQPPPPPPVVAVSSGQQTVDIEALLRAELFGSVTQVVQEQKVEDAPETTVPLKLLGVYAAETPKKASAIVSQNSGQQAVVFVDRIIIDRSGRLETLRMEDLTGQLAGMMQIQSDAPKPPPSGQQTLDKRYDPQVSAALQDIRGKLNTDPASLTDVLSVQPLYVNGEMQGYRVGPGRDRKLFARFGLQANDVVTAINGVQLNDPTQAFAMMNDLNSATELTITLRRGDQDVNLLLNLQPNPSEE